MNDKATPAQLNYIRSMLKRGEFDPRTVTFAYRRLGVGEQWMGGSVDELLDCMHKGNAGDMISKLKEIVE